MRLTWRIAWRWDWNREATRVYGSRAGVAGRWQRAQDRGMPSRMSGGELASPRDQVLPERHPAGFESRVASWGTRQLSWGPGPSGHVKAQGPCSQHLSDPRPCLSSCVTGTSRFSPRRPGGHPPVLCPLPVPPDTQRQLPRAGTLGSVCGSPQHRPQQMLRNAG